MLNENVVKVLKNNTWTVATCAAGVPNAVPVGFKDVTEDGKLVVGDVFLETTMRNVLDNGKIAVSAYDASTSEGYQVKGTAAYVTEGPVVDTFKALAAKLFHGKMTAKGAIVITPEQVIVTTPGPGEQEGPVRLGKPSVHCGARMQQRPCPLLPGFARRSYRKGGQHMAYERKLEKDIRCPLEYGMALFGGKWKSRILCVLAGQGTLRYSALRKQMGNITDAVLAAALKELLADDMIQRRSL